MMEVKQNTAVDLNELLVPPKTAEGTDELDDAMLTDLSNEAASQDLNCDLIKANEKSNNGLVLTNGDEGLPSLMDIEESDATALEEDTPVSTEMEDVLLAEEDVLLEEDDALLAEDDVLPNVTVSKISSDTSPSVAEEDILADKVETSNSTTSSTNGRDPGDDLDTLLSKINDIVDDCLENEGGTVVSEHEEIEESGNVLEKQDQEKVIPSLDTSCEKLDESVVVVEEPTDEESNIENDESQSEETNEIKETAELPLPAETEKSHKTNEVNEITHDKTKTEEASSQQQNETLEKTIDAEELSAVPHKTLLEASENTEKTTENPTEEEDADLAREEKHSNVAAINEIKVLEESKCISADVEKATDGSRSPKVEQQITTDGAEESLEQNQDAASLAHNQDEASLDHNQDESSLDHNQDEASLDHNEDETSLDHNQDEVVSLDKEEELVKNDSFDNKEDELARSDTTVEQTKQIEDTKEVSLDIQAEEKQIDDVSLEKSQEIVDATKSTDLEPKVTSGKNEECINEEATKDDKEANEDSDDEIVFYVDEKPPEVENHKEMEPEKPTVTAEIALTETSDKTATTVEVDDDIVILDDDDEVMEETEKRAAEPQKDKTIEKESQNKTVEINDDEKIEPTVAKESTKDTPTKHSTDLDMDNSDNARDEFVTDKVTTITTPTSTTTATTTCATESRKPQEIEETNSNCSSSSNLLLEAKANDNSVDDRNQEDIENDNEEEDDDGDVELIESESKEAENSSEKGEELAPPAKRLRLSEDSQVSSNVDDTSNKCQKPTELVEEKSEKEAENASLPTSTSLKRTHDVIELELDDKSNDSKVSTNAESLTKKARTEEKPKEEVTAEADVCEKKTLKEEEQKVVDEKPDFKNMIPSYKPIPLYPPPKLDTLKSENTFSLDFLKKFRKSFDKMTKQDLEEMVLQKVVEAIIHKSEFADMRDLIEKQEKLISSHRTKITELSKQFRDLEMVHNRVVKDIEQRNSQFIMPVKITRAVGLQVYIPNKKTILDSNTTTSSTSTSIIPASSPQRSISAASPHSNLTSPQRPLPSAASQTADPQTRPGSTLSSAVSAAITNAVRRGCVQKITPIRPVPSSSNSSSASTPSSTSTNAVTTSVYRSNTNQNPTSSQPRILNKSATPSSVGGGATSSANAANMQRNRYIPSNLETMRLQQQQAAAPRPTPNTQRVVVQSKPVAVNTTVPRRPEPAASTTSSNNTSSLDSYMNTLSQLTGGNTAVSITPAKPKEKAVIDLTDEDEVAPTPAPAPAPAANTSTSNTPSTNNGPASANPAQRRSLPSQTNTTNSSSQFSRNAPPLARIPPINQMSNSNKVRQTAIQGQKNTNSTFSSTISTPPGTSITRINVAANTQNPQRVKYSHPAPLPATPPQAFNPSWKLPPPRPTIRISNLDNGIVISWTMEESMDRHAECVSYQIYAYQETSGPPMADSWRHVGDVKAMLLPMAVTLTQFQEGQRYFFAVRAVDCHQRYGPFSLPKTWS